MIKIRTIATVEYTCWLTENDEQRVRVYAEETEIDIEEAVQELYAKGEIQIYQDSTESDFTTETVELLDEYLEED
jgi:hypothetical protein